MSKKLLEHVLAIVVVTSLLLGLLFTLQKNKKTDKSPVDPSIVAFAHQKNIRVSTPFGRTLFNDMLDCYYPTTKKNNKKITNTLVQYRTQKFQKNVQRSHTSRRLTRSSLKPLAAMYVNFLLVYVLVMLITYYGVQTLAVYRFVRKRQHAEILPDTNDQSAHISSTRTRLKKILRYAGKTFAAFIMFSPAYVIAYAFKTEINTDTVFFMVILASLSNGLLITYANRFYAFLVTESHKGYVDTAVVKNLHNKYTWNIHGGIQQKNIFSPFKKFPDHVFGIIFANAHSQYLATLKEQASFLITGLIIIEMALNIHGFLNYEMLRHILYHNYDFVVAIMISIFFTVKLTDIITDILIYREEKKYAN